MGLQRKIYTTRREKIIDLIIGIVVLLVLNAILGGLIYGWTFLAASYLSSSPNTVIQGVTVALNCIPFVLNIGLIVLFAVWRPWIALGMLAGIALLMLLSLCLAVVIGVACLVMLSNSQL